MSIDLAKLDKAVAEQRVVVRIVIAGFQGSSPRETGADMLVWKDGQVGTIGGGALEFQAVNTARQVLEQSGTWRRRNLRIALGPELGQCCGGVVDLFFERFSQTEISLLDGGAPAFTRPQADGISPAPAPLPAKRALQALRVGADMQEFEISDGWVSERIQTRKTPLWIYGAGHVGRAIVRVLDGLPFAITWVDTGTDRFPDDIREGVDTVVSVNPASVVCDAPDEALHFVLTYSHAHDLEICHQVLSHQFSHLGLIGSASKKARFLKRLRELGHSDAQRARLQCPIGDKALGKEPAAIAIGLAQSLIRPIPFIKTKEACA